MNKRIILLSFISISYSHLLSQDKKDTISTQDVVVSGIRNNSPVLKIDRKTFKAGLYGQEVQALSNLTPGMISYSDGGQGMGYSYMRLRGMDQTRLNITLNGVPMNDMEDQGTYFSNYPDFLGNVQSYQVQPGVGTTSYGTSSYAGSINFESVSPFNEKKTMLFGSAGSFNSYRVGVEHNTGVDKRGLGAYIRFSKIQSDGYRNNSGNAGQTYFFSLGKKYKSSILKFTFFLGSTNNQMAYLGSHEDSIKMNRKYNPLSPNEVDNFTQNHIQLQYSKFFKNGGVLSSTSYYNRIDGKYTVNVSPDLYGFALSSDMFGSILNYKITVAKINMTVGANVNYFKRRHSSSLVPDWKTEFYANNGVKTDYSAFLKIDRSIGRFKLYVDLQYRVASFRYVATNDSIKLGTVQWNFFNPKGGIDFSIDHNSKLYTYIGVSNREPARNDLFNGYDNVQPLNRNKFIGIGYIGSDTLNINNVKPEKVTDIEFGYSNNSNKLKFNTNLFYMQFKNEIASIGKMSYIGLPLRKNVDESYRYGLEVDGVYEINSHFMIRGNYTHIEAKIKKYTTDYDNITYTNVTPLSTPNDIANLGFIAKNKHIELALDYRYVGSSFLDNTENRNLMLGSYNTLNSRLTFNHSGFSASVIINNITNEKYNNAGYTDGVNRYYFVAPLRNYFVSLSYSF